MMALRVTPADGHRVLVNSSWECICCCQCFKHLSFKDLWSDRKASRM